MESNFTVEEVSYDLHNLSIPNEVMTEYEKISRMGISIKYGKFSKNGNQ